jgi:hypothetical protein
VILSYQHPYEKLLEKDYTLQYTAGIDEHITFVSDESRAIPDLEFPLSLLFIPNSRLDRMPKTNIFFNFVLLGYIFHVGMDLL